MGKLNAIDLDCTNNSDGFDVAGGTTKRKLVVTGADITMTGTGSSVMTFPSSSQNIIGDTATQTLSNKSFTTPTIGDFTNANHDHTNAANGGVLRLVGIASNGSGGDFTTTSTTFVDVTGMTLTFPASGATTYWAVTIQGTATPSSTAGCAFQMVATNSASFDAVAFEYATLAASAWTLAPTTGSGNSTGTIMTSAVLRVFAARMRIGITSAGGTLRLQGLKVTSGTLTVGLGTYIQALKVG